MASRVGNGLSGSGAGGLGSIGGGAGRLCGATSNGRRGAGMGLPPPPPAGPSAGKYTTFNGIGGSGVDAVAVGKLKTNRMADAPERGAE